MPDRPTWVSDALAGRCPACRAATLFASPIGFAARCPACGLDFTAFNVGDGPAAFLTLIIGALVVLGATLLEVGIGPPFWVHLLIWPAVTFALVIGGLRVAKAALLANEYRVSREGGLR